MMQTPSLHAVTGAFGYTGKYIAKKLLAKGHSVVTLTNSASRANDFAGKVRAFPFNFDKPDEMVSSLKGVDVLYNTYWVRFNHRLFRHADAIQNTLVLFEAARKAGVRRIVHISITNPSTASPLEYFSGKARLEEALAESGTSYAILRPTVVFGQEDILINNIAWAIRSLPVFGVFGDGNYRLQPIFVEDLADLAVRWGEKTENLTINANGPETLTYRQLVETIAKSLGIRRKIVPVPPSVGYWVGRLLSLVKRDVTITRQEIQGLMSELLYVNTPPTGLTRLTDWIESNSATLGLRYNSELARRLDRSSDY
ncbi:MAG TPA: NAD(P)H-binding protein [Candidatus Deferrimicrobium sp.]|nr:NAD(P)H-binding protein [Candidatus Deferrimicrobium sp.]